MSRIAELIVDIVTLGISRYRRIKRQEAREAAERKAELVRALAEKLQRAHEQNGR